jgi:hypothetical protein
LRLTSDDNTISLYLQYFQLPSKNYLEKIRNVSFFLDNRCIYSYSLLEDYKDDYSLTLEEDYFRAVFKNFPQFPDLIIFSFGGGRISIYFEISSNNAKLKIDNIIFSFY